MNPLDIKDSGTVSHMFDGNIDILFGQFRKNLLIAADLLLGMRFIGGIGG